MDPPTEGAKTHDKFCAVVPALVAVERGVVGFDRDLSVEKLLAVLLAPRSTDFSRRPASEHEVKVRVGDQWAYESRNRPAHTDSELGTRRKFWPCCGPEEKDRTTV
jgi:hypothetical protein